MDRIYTINLNGEEVELGSAESLEHIQDTSNPHNVTKAQIGLGMVDNTTDMDKPISTIQRAEFKLKENVSNKVTSLSGETTDTQYPSAKLLYDISLNTSEMFSNVNDYLTNNTEVIDNHEDRLIYLETIGGNPIVNMQYLFLSEKSFSTLTGGDNHPDLSKLNNGAIYYTWDDEASSDDKEHGSGGSDNQQTNTLDGEKILGILGTLSSGGIISVRGTMSGNEMTWRGTVRNP